MSDKLTTIKQQSYKLRSLSPPWIPSSYELDIKEKSKKKVSKKKTMASDKSKKEKDNILGILGQRQDLSRDQISDILNAITEDLPPINKIICPEEGTSSIHIETWADNNKIPFQSCKSDWTTNGKASRAIRDKHIETEAKFFLIFIGPRSDYYKQVAERIALKEGDDAAVFIQPYSLKEPIEQLIIEQPLKKPPPSSFQLKERGRTLDKRKDHSQQLSIDQPSLLQYLKTSSKKDQMT
jgi:hypothetical protein